MAVSTTLKQYIEEADKIIANKDKNAAEKMVTRILSVFGREYEGLKDHLNRYSYVGIISTWDDDIDVESTQQDDLGDLALLRDRLQAELEKIEGDGMRSLLAHFPTEKIILHKTTGETFELDALVSSSGIQSENISIPIELNDYFERVLPNGVCEYYSVTDPGFHKGMGGIPDHYQTKVKQLKNAPTGEIDNERQKMIFISHSSDDKEYTKAFVDLLFAIGLNEDDIVCSSYPGVGVPLGESVYKWLVEKFQKYDLHVLYFLSHNYYESAASLNEMGAAWAMKQKWDGILLPGFDFADIAGCIDKNQIQIKLDGELDELKHRLWELKNDIVEEYGLRKVSDTRWEKIRDEFINTVRSISS